MQEFKIALFIDVDNVKLKKESFEELLLKLKEYGKIVFCRLYNFSDRKNKDLTQIINTNGYTTAVMTEQNKKTKRNFFDIRIAIDATKLAVRNHNIDAYCIYCGEAKGDVTPLISSLKADGKYLIEVLSVRAASICPIFDERLTIYSSNEIAIKPAITVKKQSNNFAKKTLKNNFIRNGNVDLVPEAQDENGASISKEEIIKAAKEQVEEAAKSLRISEKEKIAKEMQIYREAELGKIAEQKKVAQEELRKEIEMEKQLEEKREKEEAKELIEDRKRDIENTYIKNFKETKTLNENLEDFARRTSELNFDYNKDIDAKLELLFDIEECLAKETSSGRGKNSKNERERNAFSEIESLILSLKEAILDSMDKELVNEQNYNNLHPENAEQKAESIIESEEAEKFSKEELREQKENQPTTEKYYYENEIMNQSDEDYDF